MSGCSVKLTRHVKRVRVFRGYWTRLRCSAECFWFITAGGCHAHLERLARVKRLKENTDDTFNVSSQYAFVALRWPQTTVSCVSAHFSEYFVQPLSQIASCAVAEILCLLNTFLPNECRNKWSPMCPIYTRLPWMSLKEFWGFFSVWNASV